MKNFVKWFGIIAFVAIIGFSMVSCDLNNNDYEKLNGVWDRGDIVITFNDSNAVFTQINSNSGWIQAQNNGYISIGGKKFRNIKKTNDLKWSCEELSYDKTTYVTRWNEGGVITMSADGRTIQVSTPNVETTPAYTKR